MSETSLEPNINPELNRSRHESSTHEGKIEQKIDVTILNVK